jgi:hypothetical protein
MTSQCKAYPDKNVARRAVAELLAAGVPPRDIRLLIGRPPHDTRHEPVGTYAGSIGPEAPVGTYGGRVLRRGRAPAPTTETPTGSARAPTAMPTAS